MNTGGQPQGYAVLVPAFEEAGRIGAVLDEIGAETGPGVEIVVVDDGSRDETAAVALGRGATVIRLPFNLGYGAALQTGYKYALEKGYRFVIQMDADGQHDPAYIHPLLDAVATGGADLALGSRFLGEGDYRMPLARRAFVRVIREVVRLLTGQRVTDPTSGMQALGERALRFYATDAYPIDFPDADVLLMLHARGMRFVERPVRMRPSVKPAPMHGGLRAVYYVFKMCLSILVVLLRGRSGEGGGNDSAA